MSNTTSETGESLATKAAGGYVHEDRGHSESALQKIKKLKSRPPPSTSSVTGLQVLPPHSVE